MDRNQKILLVTGLAITVLLFAWDIYAGLIALVIMIALGMSVLIMEDTRNLPDLVAGLRENASLVYVRNRGNAPARSIQVALVPHNIVFNIPEIVEESQYEYPLEEMLVEAKAVITYENFQGARFQKTFMLSAMGTDDEDLLKPAFPLFKWK